VRSSPRARQAKSRARLDRYEQMATEAASRTRLDFEEIQIPPGPRLGSLVVEAGHLVKGFGGRMLIDDLDRACAAGYHAAGRRMPVAVALRQRRPCGRYDNAEAAARGVACACGK
jgi:hypothetical protein